MDAVVKVGGSLTATPVVLRALCEKLGRLAERHRLLVIPGGGDFADIVRQVDRQYSLNPIIAHKMAILGMDQYGFLLSELIPNSLTIPNVAKAVVLWKSKRIVVFLPSRIMLEEDPLEKSWDVTSDSIAAYIADRLSAQNLILITNVDGLFTHDPKTHRDTKLVREIFASELLKQSHRTCVDIVLPKLLLESRLSCFIVNGKYPERIEKILANETTICTRVVAK